MESGQVPMDSAANTPGSGSIQSIQPHLSIAEQGTLQPPPPSTPVAVPSTTSLTLTPTSPQEGTRPHDSQAPLRPAIPLQSKATSQSTASSESHPTPGGSVPSTHPWTKGAGSSGDKDGEDGLLFKKPPHSELNSATKSPVNDENVGKEEKGMTDQPLPTHKEKQVSFSDSSELDSSAASSPHLSEDSSSDSDSNYGTPPPSPPTPKKSSQLSLSLATPSSTSSSPQSTNEDQNTGSSSDWTDVESEMHMLTSDTLSGKDSSEEVKSFTGPKPAASKVTRDEVQDQSGNQSDSQLRNQSDENVEVNNNTTTSSTTSGLSNKEKGNGKPLDFASDPLSDTSQPNDGGTQGDTGAGLDNIQTSQKVSMFCFIMLYYSYC